MKNIILKDIASTPLAVALLGSVALVVNGGWTFTTVIISVWLLVGGFIAGYAISRDATTTTDGANRQSNQLQGNAGRLKSLASDTGSFGDMAAEISTMASLTSLLALNAKIEAARSGEKGRGLATAADGVGQLAADVIVGTRNDFQNTAGDTLVSLKYQKHASHFLENIIPSIDSVEIGMATAVEKLETGLYEELTDDMKALEQIKDKYTTLLGRSNHGKV